MELKFLESPNDLIRLAFVGMLDGQAVQQIELKFIGHTVTKGKSTIVDLSETIYIGSLGVGMLLNVAKSLERKGARLAIVNPQPAVLEVLKITHLTDVLRIAPDMAAAEQLVRS